ncbi:hypothetical protein FBALC1_08738 [Flavobacteriales bacterium ALC-1]|nr:hypothetical protein FBALC1_08738 [Flavobacteriales bacterium ALC-1]
MTIKLRLLSLVTFLFLKIGFSQDAKVTITSSDLSETSFLERTEFKVSYSGSIFWNNGINLGAEYLFKEYTKVKNRKRGLRTNTHQFLLNGTLGFTTNFSTKTDTGIFTNYGITWRRTNKKGKQFSIAINPLGYYRSFLPETYKVTGDNVEKVFLPGRGYYAPSLTIGIGKQRLVKNTGRFFNITSCYAHHIMQAPCLLLIFSMATVLTLKRKKNMQKIIKNCSKVIVLIITLCTVFSCSNDIDFNNLNDTIFVRHRNADMPAYIHGNGSEKVFLIILHGGPGGIGLSYRSSTIKSDIEKECAVVYFDQRGSGMAQGSYSESGISIDIMAEDILALVKVIKHKYGNDSRFFLMGHSWGGTLGPATLLKDQSDFLGWIDVDGAHNTQGMYLEYIANFNRVALEQIEAENDIAYWESVLNLINTIAPEYNLDDVQRLNSEAFEAEAVLHDAGLINSEAGGGDNIIFNYTPLTILWNMQNTQSILDSDLFQNINFQDRLSEITIPSLVLWGRHDMVVPIKFAQDSYDNLGSIEKELVFFENSGHSPMSTEPDLFAEKVIEFINQNK